MNHNILQFSLQLCQILAYLLKLLLLFISSIVIFYFIGSCDCICRTIASGLSCNLYWVHVCWLIWYSWFTVNILNIPINLITVTYRIALLRLILSLICWLWDRHLCGLWLLTLSCVRIDIYSMSQVHVKI